MALVDWLYHGANVIVALCYYAIAALITMGLVRERRIAVRELADLVIELTGTSSVVKHEPLPKDDPKQRRPDITRARRMLGWEPTVPVREGVSRTIEYFRSLMGTGPAPARV